MAGSRASAEKVAWSGRIMAIQPRIRLMRSFDERSRSCLGYVLCIDGTCGGEAGEFLIAVGEAAHEKHRLQTGIELSGYSLLVEDPRKETAALYKTSGLKVVRNAEGETHAGPPFLGVPRRIGLTRTPPRIGGRMIEDAEIDSCVSLCHC